MTPALSVASEMEAINYTLRAAGALQIDTMDELSPEAEDVLKYLDRHRASILENGWGFNKDESVALNTTPIETSPQKTEWVNEGEIEHVVLNIQGSTESGFPDGDYTLYAEAPQSGELLRFFHVDGKQMIRLSYCDLSFFNYGMYPPLSYGWRFVLVNNNTLFYAHTKPQADPMPLPSIEPYASGITWISEAFMDWNGQVPQVAVGNEFKALSPKAVPAIHEERLIVPSNTLACVTTAKALRHRWVLRNGTMYDRIDSTYKWTTTGVEVDITYLFEFEECPLAFREWFTYSAAADYLADVVQDLELSQRASALAQMAKAEARAYDIRNSYYTLKK